MKKTNEQKSEKRNFKEVVIANKGKIIAGVSMIGLGTISLILYKQNKSIKLVRSITQHGCLEEAIATVNRKINYRIEKIKCLENGGLDEEKKLVLTRYRKELDELINEQKLFVEEYERVIHDS